MKRYIRSSSDIDTIHNGAFSELASEASNCGYSLSVTEDMQMMIKSGSGGNYLPDITVETARADGAYVFNPTVSFPTLAYDDMENYNDIEYYIEQWTKVGSFISKLISFQYDPADWIDE